MEMVAQCRRLWRPQFSRIGGEKLIASGFETQNLSVVGNGYHTDEKVVGFYTTGDR